MGKVIFLLFPALLFAQWSPPESDPLLRGMIDSTRVWEIINGLQFPQSPGEATFTPGGLAAKVYQSKTMSNIGANYVDVYVAAFDDENQVKPDFSGADSLRILYTWDYVGAGQQSIRWVNVADNTQVLYEVTGITSDRDGTDTGWFPLPATFTDITVALEIQGKSTTTTDDPICKGYAIFIR